MVVEEECRSQVLGLPCPLDGTRIKLVWQVVCQINGVCIIFLSIGLICGLILGIPGCIEEWLPLWKYYMIVGLSFVIYEALKHAAMIFMLSSPLCINWPLIAYYMVFYVTGVWVDEIYHSLKIKSKEKKVLEAKAEMKEKDGAKNGCYTCWYEKE